MLALLTELSGLVVHASKRQLHLPLVLILIVAYSVNEVLRDYYKLLFKKAFAEIYQVSNSHDVRNQSFQIFVLFMGCWEPYDRDLLELRK